MNEETMSNQNVINRSGELLSALMDGELARDQIRFLLRSVEVESDLTRRWANYHVISATLRHEFIDVTLPANFADAVIGRIDAESVESQTSALNVRRGMGALRWVGGGAIAAAVAVVALVVSRPVGDNAASSGAPLGPAVAQTSPAYQSRLPYLPLSQPAAVNPLPLAGFNADNVMPASFDSVLPSYYSPRGNLLSRNGLSAATVPYILYVAPVQHQADAQVAPQ